MMNSEETALGLIALACVGLIVVAIGATAQFLFEWGFTLVVVGLGIVLLVCVVAMLAFVGSYIAYLVGL